MMRALLWTVTVGLLALLTALLHVVQVQECSLRWRESGTVAEWRDGDCKVRRKDGRWVPEAAVRDIGLMFEGH